MVNLSSFIAFHARTAPNREALLYGGRRITYAELLEDVEVVAGWLAQRGLGAGDVVAVLMKNSAAFIVISIAVSHFGAVFLPINFRLAADEVGFITGNAGAKLLLVDEELQARVAGSAEMILVDASAQIEPRCLARNSAPVAAVRRLPTDLFRLMYTSGTTDRPKGVMHSYENFYWKCADHGLALGLGKHTRLLVVGPLYHVGAYDCPGLAALWFGGLICLLRDFEPEAVLAAIAAERLDGAWLAPVMTGGLLRHAVDGTSHDLSSLRWAVGGGERTPESRVRGFGKLFPNARYVDGYGLTETCGGDTFMEAGREIEKIGSTGRALAHVEVEIHDEYGAPVPRGHPGEIYLRGPKITKGYWRDHAKTAASFRGDWFRSGDIGYLDDDGFLFLTDRKKDLILSGGENIASLEVERVLHEIPEIREAAVIGVADETWGERPVAVVALVDGATLDLSTLARHCRTRLASFKVPRELIVRDSLPRTPSGKVLKRVLRDELAAQSAH
jgi:fatty-acyl-CoA synthase